MEAIVKLEENSAAVSKVQTASKAKLDENGFIAFPDFLNKVELNEVEENLARFLEKVLPNLPSNQVFYEDKKDRESLKQVQALHVHDAFFHSLMVGSKFQALAEHLVGERVVAVNFQFFRKPPGGLATPPHQDGFYFMLEPPGKAITLWLALDKVDNKNGCLGYKPGSHKLGLQPHQPTNTLGFSQGLTVYSEDGEVEMTANPGDLVAHLPGTVHKAGPNQSKRPRRALGMIFYASSAVERVEKKKYQEELNKQLHQKGRL